MSEDSEIKGTIMPLPTWHEGMRQHVERAGAGWGALLTPMPMQIGSLRDSEKAQLIAMYAARGLKVDEAALYGRNELVIL